MTSKPSGAKAMDLADDYGIGFYDAGGGGEVVFADGEIIFDCYWE